MREQQIQARWIALLAASAIALYLCWLMLQPFLGVLIWAAVLVVVFYPVHRRLVARTHRPATSALLSSLLVIVAILAPLSLITFALFQQLSGLMQNLPANLSSILDPNSPITGRVLGWLRQYVNVDQLLSEDFIAERVRSMSGTIAGRTLGGVVGAIGGVLGAIVQIFFIIFTMYYLFRDGDRIVSALPNMMPLEKSQSEEILTRTREVIAASVYGVLVIAVIQGALGGLAFWMLGLPSPLVWAVVMTFLSMIPMAGSFVVWVPAAIYLALTGHWTKAILLTAWGALAIGTVDNFLRPKLVGEKTKLHELLIFFSVLGGLSVFGMLGIVLGPVVVAVTLAILDIFRRIDRPARELAHQPTMVEEVAEPDAHA